jgi:outer membrane protein OmpA-like peptidoglycan-associated protein
MALTFALLSLAAAANGAAKEPPPRIPLVAGLTITAAISEQLGDYEAIYQVQSVGKDTYRMTLAAEVPDALGEGTHAIDVSRNVMLEDHRSARIIRPRFYESDSEVFRGTTPFFSSAIVSDLRKTGTTRLTWRQVESMLGIPLESDYTGTLRRIGTTTLPVLVNGRRVALAAIHAGGRLLAGQDVFDADVYILDDPDNPILLRSRSGSVIRIDFPVQQSPGDSLEGALAQRRKVDVYGIYFAFNSANIRPQSQRTLEQLAAILKKNPDWKLRVDGHTDDVGGDASNLDLSRRRAAAVKAALVQMHAVAAERLVTGGYGEGVPRERNDTTEGRARNRRVELTRL